MQHSEVAVEMEGKSWGDFKPMLGDALVQTLAPVRAEHTRLVAEPQHLDAIIRSGAERASETAEATLREVKAALGMLPPVL